MRELKNLFRILMILAAMLVMVPAAVWASFPKEPSQWRGSPRKWEPYGSRDYRKQKSVEESASSREPTWKRTTPHQAQHQAQESYLRPGSGKPEPYRKKESYRESASSRENAWKNLLNSGQESYRRQKSQRPEAYRKEESNGRSTSSRETAWKRTSTPGQDFNRRQESRKPAPYRKQESFHQQKPRLQQGVASHKPKLSRRVEKPKVLETCAVIPEREMAEIRGCLGDSYFFALDIVGNINMAGGASNFQVNFQANVPPGVAPQFSGTTVAFNNGTVNFQAGAGTSSLGTGIFQVVQVAGINNMVIANTNVTLNIQGLMNMATKIPVSSLLKTGIGGLSR